MQSERDRIRRAKTLRTSQLRAGSVTTRSRAEERRARGSVDAAVGLERDRDDRALRPGSRSAHDVAALGALEQARRARHVVLDHPDLVVLAVRRGLEPRTTSTASPGRRDDEGRLRRSRLGRAVRSGRREPRARSSRRRARAESESAQIPSPIATAAAAAATAPSASGQRERGRAARRSAARRGPARGSARAAPAGGAGASAA